jgi:eukaryotic-like serine/threonine-protein kinase
MPDPEQVHHQLEHTEDLVQHTPAPDFIDDRYELESVIGEGGMGTVYKAKHLLLNRLVAIKLLKHQACSSPKAVRRFQQEAKAATALNHENIASVREFGLTQDGSPFLL